MNPPDSEGTLMWRIAEAERRLRDLDTEKADVKDVSRLADEFKSLRLTLQWFMGVVAAGAVAFIVLAIQLATH